MATLSTLLLLGAFVSLLGLVVGLAYPAAFRRLFGGKIPARKRLALVLSLLTAVLLVISISIAPREFKTDTSTAPAVSVSGDTKQIHVEVLKNEDSGNVRNISLLVDPNQDQAVLKKLATQYNKSNCEKDCNIYVWDDRTAFQYQDEIDALVASGLRENLPPNQIFSDDEINSHVLTLQHCKYIGEHAVGELLLSDPDSWAEYPLRDASCEEGEQKILDKQKAANEKVKNI